MHVYNLVYIVNISFYDASYLIHCWKERLRSVVRRWSITTNNFFTNKIRSYRDFARPNTEYQEQMYVHTFSGHLREIVNHTVINHSTCSVSSQH